MKKFYVVSLLIVFDLTANTIFAQAKKYPLFEHFTQASCEPCADQNPIFHPVYLANETNVHHIAYHTSWPGVDPMYDFNPTESDVMVTYYGVLGVPDMYGDGVGYGSPVNITQDVVNDLTSESSPIRVLVTETTVGSTRNVHIEIQTVGTVPSGSFRLKAAVIEGLIDYSSAPGSNGETEFPNVFRESLTGTGGVVITLASTGSSIEYDYSYPLDSEYDDDEIYVVAWVQNSTTKEILNSGATGDPDVEVVNVSDNTFTEEGGMFESNVINLGDADANLTITLDAQQPAGWDASLMYDGTTITSGSTVTSDALSEIPLHVHVMTGAGSGIGSYTVTVTNDDEPTWSPMVLRYYTIQDVTDLIVNNNSAFGDGSLYGTWENEVFYEDGISAAGITTSGMTTDNVFNAGMKGGALAGVENVYYNVGWTFPALTKDELRENLTTYLENGGNLFISGQDIGWEIDFYADNGLPAAKNFYEDYLHATFVNDDAGSTDLTSIASDVWFGTTAASTIDDDYYPANYYPELIEPADDNGIPIFSWDGNDNDVAGIRSEVDGYKTVYLGIGLEQIIEADIRNAILDLSYQYFKGLIEGIDFDNALQGLLGNASPNPANTETIIELNNISEGMLIQITDITGKIISSEQVPAGAVSHTVNVSNLQSGMYFYTLSDGVNTSPAGKFNVIK
ncbi:MAG: T9SS type A sorting domain-containing protein [Chitinophagales bacterium]